jgi:hypothetical protein
MIFEKESHKETSIYSRHKLRHEVYLHTTGRVCAPHGLIFQFRAAHHPCRMKGKAIFSNTNQG